MKRRIVSKIKIKLKAKINKRKVWKKHLKDEFKISECLKFFLKKPKRNFLKVVNQKDYFRHFLRFLLSSRIAIVLLFFIMLWKTLQFNISLDTPEHYNQFVPIFFTIFGSILILPLFFVKKDKNRFRLVMFYDIAYSLLLFADNVYWEYFADLLSISQISYLKYAEEIGGTIGHLVKPEHFIYFIDIPIILAIWHISRKPINKKKSRFIKNRGKRRIVLGILYTAVIFIVMIPMSNFIYDQMNGMICNKRFQVEEATILGYHFLDIHNAINIKDTAKYKTYDEMKKDYEKLTEYKDEHFEEENIYGIAKEKNVIVVQLESVQNFVVDKTINGKEITPNLNKFLRDNIEVSKMISQSYSTTADSEYTAITSLYPLENGQAFSSFFSSLNNDIFRLYKNEGYKTYYMHGNSPEFWNRKSVFNRLSLDGAVFLEDFEDNSEMINRYLSDELFYKQAVQKLEKSGSPFFTFLTAASSHTAFELTGIENKYSKVNIDVRKI